MTAQCYLEQTGDVDDLTDDLFLTAISVEEHACYGYAVPTATAAEFQRVIAALRRNDPNGTWNPEGVTEGDGALIYEDEVGRCVWPVAGMVDGSPVYRLDGWGWGIR